MSKYKEKINDKRREILEVSCKTQSGSDLHFHRRSLQYYRRWEA